ncbi:MAG: hypothetical protein BGO10_08285 [Chlamydia sp. 32-24]|nr:MAG: hypothetical protein BGO10_08285 [Chlamydia sp. 32-24]
MNRLETCLRKAIPFCNDETLSAIALVSKQNNALAKIQSLFKLSCQSISFPSTDFLSNLSSNTLQVYHCDRLNNWTLYKQRITPDLSITNTKDFNSIPLKPPHASLPLINNWHLRFKKEAKECTYSLRHETIDKSESFTMPSLQDNEKRIFSSFSPTFFSMAHEFSNRIMLIHFSEKKAQVFLTSNAAKNCYCYNKEAISLPMKDFGKILSVDMDANNLYVVAIGKKQKHIRFYIYPFQCNSIPTDQMPLKYTFDLNKTKDMAFFHFFQTQKNIILLTNSSFVLFDKQTKKNQCQPFNNSFFLGGFENDCILLYSYTEKDLKIYLFDLQSNEKTSFIIKDCKQNCEIRLFQDFKGIGIKDKNELKIYAFNGEIIFTQKVNPKATIQSLTCHSILLKDENCLTLYSKMFDLRLLSTSEFSNHESNKELLFP